MIIRVLVNLKVSQGEKYQAGHIFSSPLSKVIQNQFEQTPHLFEIISTDNPTEGIKTESGVAQSPQSDIPEEVLEVPEENPKKRTVVKKKSVSKKKVTKK